MKGGGGDESTLPYVSKVGFIKDEKELCLVVQALQRVSHALGEVPNVPDAERLHLRPPLFIDRRYEKPAFEHDAPIRPTCPAPKPLHSAFIHARR